MAVETSTAIPASADSNAGDVLGKEYGMSLPPKSAGSLSLGRICAAVCYRIAQDSIRRNLGVVSVRIRFNWVYGW